MNFWLLWNSKGQIIHNLAKKWYSQNSYSRASREQKNPLLHTFEAKWIIKSVKTQSVHCWQGGKERQGRELFSCGSWWQTWHDLLQNKCFFPMAENVHNNKRIVYFCSLANIPILMFHGKKPALPTSSNEMKRRYIG